MGSSSLASGSGTGGGSGGGGGVGGGGSPRTLALQRSIPRLRHRDGDDGRLHHQRYPR